MLLPLQQPAFGPGVSTLSTFSPITTCSLSRLRPSPYYPIYQSPSTLTLLPRRYPDARRRIPHNRRHPAAAGATCTSLQFSYHTTLQSAAATILPHVLSFLKFLLVFTAGGLFFSSVMAWCTATYALGTDNMTRITAMARLVWENYIWLTFTQGLSATKEALLAEDDDDDSDGFMIGDLTEHAPATSRRRRSRKKKKNWRDAWRVFWQKLRETRLQAVEGVNAMRREANMYAAAVGPPGLIPLQYLLDRLMPYSIASSLEESLMSALAQVETVANSSVQKATLSHFTAGDDAPKLEAARVYDLGSKAVAFDFDVAWESAMEATIQVYTAGGLARLPVTLTNAQFHGAVRVILCPLIKEQPGWGAVLYSFPSMPKISMDVRVAGGELTKVPRLRAELISAIENGIEESMIWPKRAVVPSRGAAKNTVVPQSVLNALAKTDPLLEAEIKLGARPMLRRKLDKITQLLYEDNEADNELLKSIVELPMPTFQEQTETMLEETYSFQYMLEQWQHLTRQFSISFGARE